VAANYRLKDAYGIASTVASTDVAKIN